VWQWIQHKSVKPATGVAALKAKRTPCERHSKNVPGDFYVEDEMCLTCCLAEGEAPDLIGFHDNSGHCYFKKQPTTPEEVDRAIMALAVSDVAAHRYGGTNPAILHRLKELGCEEQCDHPMPEE
jgi:hypothetical protein